MPTELKCNDFIIGTLPSDEVIDTDRMTFKDETATVQMDFRTKFNTKSFLRICGFDVIVCPKKIIRSGDCTIVFWDDDTKTIVRKSADVSDDSLYTAFTAALAIKTYGSNSKLKRIINKAYVEQKPKKGRNHGDESNKTD